MKREQHGESELKQNSGFIRDSYRKAVVTGMVVILSVNINMFVDGILLGSRIGRDALAAIDLSMPVYLVLCVLGAFFAAGTEIPAARAIGIGDAGKRDAFFCTGLNAAVLASLAFTALGVAFLRPLVYLLCPDAAIQDYVSLYVGVTVAGALPRIVIYIPFRYLRLDGRNGDVALMTAGMAVMNIVLDVLFVCFWDMGVFGAGLASVIATALACLYGLIRLFDGKSPYRWRPTLIHDRQDWQTIAATGFPSAFGNLCSTIHFLIANILLMSYGGGALVAVFTAVNGIWGFGECITLGVPAAGSAMMGVFSGERDNDSCRLLLREELKTGCIAGGVFLVLCLALSGVISKLYGLGESILVPLLWMALSVFPALLLNLLATYYNIVGRNIWANVLIFLQSVAMTYAALRLVISARLSTFAFLLLAQLATMLAWWAATGLHHRRTPRDSRYLMTDLENERSGRVLNFSVDADVDAIVSASERISAFCGLNGMSARDTIRLQMSMEEVMTLIRQINEEQNSRDLKFDLRAYSVGGVRGIRIGYSGVAFNPFNFTPAVGVGDDRYMGVRMIKKMVETVNYQRAFGVNTLQIQLKEGESNEA